MTALDPESLAGPFDRSRRRFEAVIVAVYAGLIAQSLNEMRSIGRRTRRQRA